jgi:phospho-N-acetylmuramoyl-pentapeptide-transferase
VRSVSFSYCYSVRDPLEIALIAAAAAGACLGFLWWNASPARIFMGDTGSMALGGLIAGLAMATRTVLLLPIIGMLFVIIAMSVVIQVISFRTTGRRVFRMSPLQHHFELAGWSR